MRHPKHFRHIEHMLDQKSFLPTLPAGDWLHTEAVPGLLPLVAAEVVALAAETIVSAQQPQVAPACSKAAVPG
jgi:hypothetical protein